jgi:hypothetical protein
VRQQAFTGTLRGVEGRRRPMEVAHG